MSPQKSPPLTTREIDQRDKKHLTGLLRRAFFTHRHLDWFSPSDWLGKQPYLALFEDQKILAALACPPGPPQTAWIKLFAVAPSLSFEKAWHHLWPLAQKKLTENGTANTVTVIDLRGNDLPYKLGGLLHKSGFSQISRVAALTWSSPHAKSPDVQPGINIRPMQEADLPAVQNVDQTAFAPIWRNSLHTLEHAHQIAAIATVAEVDEQIVGYQISTGDISGGHLARLAISPRCQNHGAGTALLHDLLTKFEEYGCVQVTVNTQIQNAPSLKLYEKFGFQQNHRTYPVYQIEL